MKIVLSKLMLPDAWYYGNISNLKPSTRNMKFFSLLPEFNQPDFHYPISFPTSITQSLQKWSVLGMGCAPQ